MQLRKYKKEFDHSYTLGPFPTFELLDYAPQLALQVHAHPEFSDLYKLQDRCREKQIPFFVGEASITRISDKEACWAAAVFAKQPSTLCATAPHVVLVNPSDMGNLGTILRSLLAFGICDLAIITPAADVFHPKVVRASMGALFRMRVQLFANFAAYNAAFGQGRDLFPFLLQGKEVLRPQSCPTSPLYALIFGNEARGLPPEFASLGKSILIPQSNAVDSLNLAVSVALGAFIFTSTNPQYYALEKDD